jgi:RIP metalloprotease RseP
MHNLEEVLPEDEDKTYRQKSYWRRLSVAVAGSTMHFIIAICVLFATLAFFGVPRASHWSIASLSPDSPATRAGLAVGDRILAIDGDKVATFDDMTTDIRSRPGQSVDLTVRHRDGSVVDVTTTLADHNTAGEAVGFLGVGQTEDYVKENPVVAVPGSFAEFGRVAGASVAGLGKIFSPGGIRDYVDTLRGQGDTQNRFVSPVGAGQLAKQAAANGPADFLYLLAAINIFLGIFNLIPLLPFDGGHVAIATYEAVRSRKGKRYFADITKMLPVTYAVVGLLLLIAVGSFYLDLAKPIGG